MDEGRRPKHILPILVVVVVIAAAALAVAFWRQRRTTEISPIAEVHKAEQLQGDQFFEPFLADRSGVQHSLPAIPENFYDEGQMMARTH